MNRLTESKPLVPGCVHRIGTWRVPPNWSRSDWLQQVRSLAASTAWEAASRYGASRAGAIQLSDLLNLVTADRSGSVLLHRLVN